jgi:hypothetical protein
MANGVDQLIWLIQDSRRWSLYTDWVNSRRSDMNTENADLEGDCSSATFSNIGILIAFQHVKNNFGFLG